MKQTLIVQAKAVEVGDTLLWDRPERLLRLTVTAVVPVVSNEICLHFALPFSALEGLGVFHLYDTVLAWAIDTDRHVLCLRQYTDPTEPLQIQREEEVH